MTWTNNLSPDAASSGTPGPQGPPGEDGAEWHNVTGTPAGSLGSLGDWALNPASGQVWQKTGTSTWTSRGSLRGPQGVQGETGERGPQGPSGADGLDGATISASAGPPTSPGGVGDLYVNTTNGDLYAFE